LGAEKMEAKNGSNRPKMEAKLEATFWEQK
jgi:hypothetical protein